MPRIKTVLHEAALVTAPGGYLCWLSTVWPLFTKREWQVVGTIGIVRSTNHRVRMLFIFQRTGTKGRD